jgi:HAD superfamily hydrolase (TIGR01509 family)
MRNLLVSSLTLTSVLHICNAFVSSNSCLSTNLRSTSLNAAEFALLFDCDGVIVETEELHRVAYNRAFEIAGLRLPGGDDVVWDVEYYDILQNTIGGGKPKMNWYFTNTAKAWPVCTKPYRAPPKSDEEIKQLIDDLQDIKTDVYREIVEHLANARPGVLELMDEAIADPRIKVGICSAATRGGFDKIIASVVGEERAGKLDVIIAGDDVEHKKPDPQIYNVAQSRIDVPHEKCVVIEDSLVGLRAANGANMNCVITYTESTYKEDFYGEGATAKLSSLAGVKLEHIFGPLRQGAPMSALLDEIRDPLHGSTDNDTREAAGRGTVKSLVAAPVADVPVAASSALHAASTVEGWTPHHAVQAPM